MTDVVGPNFFNELNHAGLAGLPITWGSDRAPLVSDPRLTSDQIAETNAVFAAHNPATPDPTVEFSTALQAGITVTSAASGLSGTYAIDPVTQQQITSEVIYIQVTTVQGEAKFTNGQTTKGWPDINGVPHIFTTDQFIPFAEAIAHFVDQLIAAKAAALAGPPWTWIPPSQPVSI